MTVHVGDCIQVMEGMPAGSVDAVVCDPPYGLEFMGKDWDRYSPRDFQAWCEKWAAEALRVLKLGGHLLAFGGTRTYHRLAAGIEDAGFEIRDTLAWMYGSGFPKSLNLTGEWDGWGTALKPAYEPVVLARKPLTGTVAGNVLEHGTGALNVDGCRVGTSKDTPASPSGVGSYGGHPNGQDLAASGMDPNTGRWPANVILDPEAAALLDQQTGDRPGFSGGGPKAGQDKHAGIHGGAFASGENHYYSDSGGASRFYYVAKASSADRNAGLNGFDEQNIHPTVKPIQLMRWLIRLVTPPGGTVLDPFTGSGTTGCAAALERVQFTGIEQDPEYARIAEARIAWWQAHPDGVTLVQRLEAEAERQATADAGQTSLFDS